jgi:hypothetical protein
MTIEIEILCSTRIEDILHKKLFFEWHLFSICNNDASSSILPLIIEFFDKCVLRRGTRRLFFRLEDSLNVQI